MSDMEDGTWNGGMRIVSRDQAEHSRDRATRENRLTHAHVFEEAATRVLVEERKPVLRQRLFAMIDACAQWIAKINREIGSKENPGAGIHVGHGECSGCHLDLPLYEHEGGAICRACALTWDIVTVRRSELVESLVKHENERLRKENKAAGDLLSEIAQTIGSGNSDRKSIMWSIENLKGEALKASDVTEGSARGTFFELAKILDAGNFMGMADGPRLITVAKQRIDELRRLRNK
jgi:hypothetical protein